MNEQTKRILFISHEATRSGAPFVLLYLLQWLQQHKKFRFDVLLIRNGPLRDEFSKVAGNVYSVEDMRQEENSRKNRIKRKFGFILSEEGRMKEIGKKINVKSYDLVYANTILSLSLAASFKENYKVPIVCAIHELMRTMELFHDRPYLKNKLSLLDMIIAGSQAVANDLRAYYDLPEVKIKVAHAFIHTYTQPFSDPQILSTVGIPSGRFIIGGASTGEWRKGVDLIVPLGMYLNRHYPAFNYHILWIGVNMKEEFVKNLLIDIEKTGLSDRITVLAGSSSYLDYINRFDVFAMLSREDPFPLVSLEAGYLEKPIVMFSGTGGTAELMQNGGGEIVAYMDVEALAKAIVDLSANTKKREEMGRILKKEVMEKYNSAVACEKVLHILESFL